MVPVQAEARELERRLTRENVVGDGTLDRGAMDCCTRRRTARPAVSSATSKMRSFQSPTIATASTHDKLDAYTRLETPRSATGLRKAPWTIINGNH